MNQQHNPQQQNHARQYQNGQTSYQSSGNASKRAELLRERLYLERQAARLHAKLDALEQLGKRWQQERSTLDARKPLAIAQALGSMIGLRLPPVARLWLYQSQRLNQQKLWLDGHVLSLEAQVATLDQERELIDSEIDLLDFS